MIEIVTSSGISLDLAPDAVFEVEFENPMMDSERIPVPFSTSIDFLPTSKNCRVFGWFPALPASPSEVSVKAEIRLCGVPFLTGTLEFEGVEDGNVQYSFSGADLSGSMELKDIADYAPLKNATGTEFNAVLHGLEYCDKVQLPIIVNAAYEGKCIKEGVAIRDKYHNLLGVGAGVPYVIPAFRMHEILSNLFDGNIDMEDFLGAENFTEFRYASILGLYKTDITDEKIGLYVSDGCYNLGVTLPKLTGAEFITNFCNLFCASVFRTRDGYVLNHLGGILKDRDSRLDWSDKVADGFSLSFESGMAYEFGYDNSDDENTLASGVLAQKVDAGEILLAGSMAEMFEKSSNVKGWAAICVETSYTGVRDGRHVYSMDWHDTYGEYLISCIYRPLEKIDTTSDDDSDDSYDASVGFSLASCVPLNLQQAVVGSLSPLCRSAAVVKLPGVGTERGSEAWIVMTDRYRDYWSGIGDYFVTDNGTHFYDGINRDIIDVDAADLRPRSMYDKYHTVFSEWLSRDRVVVSSDLHLSVSDLCNIDLSKQVYFRGKNWIIRKLTVSLGLQAGIVEASGEFIEC